MSTADLAGPRLDPAARPGHPAGPVMPWIRFLRSELSLIFLRWRTLALLAVLAAIPVLIGVALKLAASPAGGDGQGPAFLGQVAGNGVFLALVSLTVLLTLVLPLAVAVVAGDSVAGEASHGTLRYLLAIPAGRVRLLGVKYAAVVIFCLAACAVVTAAALAIGAALFPVGPVTLLSGTTLSLGAGLLRLVFVTLYVAARDGRAGRDRAGHLDPDRASDRGHRRRAGARAGQRGNRQRAAVRGGAPVPADALVALVRRAAPVAGRVAGSAARAGIVRQLRDHFPADRVGPVHHG